MRKRIGLARAIVLSPEVILYDEPTTGLDPIRADVINELILRLKQRLGVTSIVVTHDLVSAYKVADYMVLLHGGRVQLAARPTTFGQAPTPSWWASSKPAPRAPNSLIRQSSTIHRSEPAHD